MKRFLLTFSVVALILFARLPHALLHPALFAEDGNIFFKQQYESGFFKSFFVNYAGYTHAVPRIIAGACSLVPLEQIPFAYALVSLLIAAASLSLLALPIFRQVIQSDGLRSLCCVVLTLMPDNEALMKLAYINWYILFAFLLLLLIDLPSRKWWLLPLVLLATWTSPVPIVTTPIILYRCVTGRNWGERIWWGLVQVSLVLYLLHSESPPHTLKSLAHDHSWVVSLFDSLCYRVGVFFAIGDYFSSPPFINGWGTVRILGLAGLVLLAPMLYWMRCRLNRTFITLGYLVVATSCLYVLRPESWKVYLEWTDHAWDGNGRHFYCSVLLLCVALGMVCEQYRLFERKVFPAIFGAWICCHAIHFRFFEWHSPVPWKEVALHIRSAESKQEAREIPVPISPQSFDFVLHVNSQPRLVSSASQKRQSL